MLYVIVVVPADTPITTPVVAYTVAIEALPVVHVPPDGLLPMTGLQVPGATKIVVLFAPASVSQVTFTKGVVVPLLTVQVPIFTGLFVNSCARSSGAIITAAAPSLISEQS